MPDTHANHLQLAGIIRQLFKDGLSVDQGVVHYLDSTFSSHDIHTLETVLQDPWNCERDPLIELLYFPDESIQIRLEDFLEKAAFAKEDEATVLDLLGAAPMETVFHFPGRKAGWKIHTPRAGTSAFLRRLKIADNPDPRIIAAIQSNIPAPQQRRCKVGIRNAVFPREATHVDGLEAFLLTSDTAGAGFMQRFCFFLQFLSEWQGGTDLWGALVLKKRLYLKQLHQAHQAETQRQNRNIETLMVMGVRSPHADPQDIAAKIAMLDDIGLAIFDRTVYVNESIPDNDRVP